MSVAARFECPKQRRRCRLLQEEGVVSVAARFEEGGVCCSKLRRVRRGFLANPSLTFVLFEL
ncbi:hypothetical protein AMTR_s00038p00227290 [Amborella trichopoda]|uniref:Uncharacterized protein n=1 Tax=Amborella trichopoda TaxID=13333 RepID=U5D2Y8_AMBTC|nr:hypothetical protein AMTR_s00038p00227290 [Amborella trichopoda]